MCFDPCYSADMWNLPRIPLHQSQSSIIQTEGNPSPRNLSLSLSVSCHLLNNSCSCNLSSGHMTKLPMEAPGLFDFIRHSRTDRWMKSKCSESNLKNKKTVFHVYSHCYTKYVVWFCILHVCHMTSAFNQDDSRMLQRTYLGCFKYLTS